ncbi:Uncharacterised protein [Serratia marcescens]|nr:Uncharacterised protein [Serratia marcescens]
MTASPADCAADRRRRTAPTSFAQWRRCGTLRPGVSRAVRRCRNSRGGTIRHPRHGCAGCPSGRRPGGGTVRPGRHRGGVPPDRRSAAGWKTGRSRARRFRRGLPARPCSCRRSSRRPPSAATRARRRSGRVSARARRAGTGFPALRSAPAVHRRTLRRAPAGAPPDSPPVRSKCSRRRWRPNNDTSPAAATDSRRNSGCARRCPAADATSAAHRPR